MFLIRYSKFLKTRLKLINSLNRTISNNKHENLDITKIRNIGIMAHIDAGKTTTTERMLFYSGKINQMGEVHHGNTVTDYMAQERERGITITSAAITFPWKKHQFNLIDTPGHIDFTMEVEQTNNVLDGAIVVLDASAGVEAQTLTVWKQADRYCIPRIVFVNKMDRLDADFSNCCHSIEDKFQLPVIPTQIPLKINGDFIGIIDVLSMEKIMYNKSNEKQVSRENITEQNEPKLWELAKEARAKAVDLLSVHSDTLANLVISSESLDDVGTCEIVKAMREVTLKQQAVPVLLGSAYKNVGVQPLMDAVILYLPAPNDRNLHFRSFDDNLCARAFKIKHDKQKGTLVFFRVYNGEFCKNQRVYSIQRSFSEQAGKIYEANADEFRERDAISSGNIVVVSGLKQIICGDLITNSQSSAQKAMARMSKTTKQETVDELFSSGAQIPEPVFFCSIEPPSLAYQTVLDQALLELQREDPSLRVENDPETGQTVLSGMGELHLEIIKDRILREYKVDAELGPLQIAYREAPIAKLTDSAHIDTKIGNSKQMINVKLSLLPTNNQVADALKFDKTADAASNIASIYPKHLVAIRQGVEVGLAHGPKISSRVVNVEIVLHWFEAGRGTSDSMISATITQLVQKLIRKAGTNILEPVMCIEIVTPDEYLSAILADLSRRRSDIQNVFIRGNMKGISGNVPLAELLGYSTILRTISSGTASFVMEFNRYQIMSASDEDAAIRSVRGF